MSNYAPPQVDDYHSDDSEDHVLESFRRSPAANVAAKRSHPSDLGAEKAPAQDKVVNIDLQSDSGYSSHTAATMSSADSAPSAKSSQSPPMAPASAAPLPPSSPATTSTARRRPTMGEERKSSSNGSPRRPLQRTSSVSSRRPPTERERRPTVDCTDPNCTKCGPNALPTRSRRPPAPHRDSALDISYTPSDQRSQRSEPTPSYTMPPSPTYSRQPAPYTHGSALVQPAQTRPRSTSISRRPMSYHGDPSQGYWVPGMPAPYPSPPQENHGPPPSMSTRYNNMQHPQMPQYMMGTSPGNGYYPPGHPAYQTSPPYETQRPPLSARNSSNYTTRRNSGYGPALITQEQNQPLPSARFPSQPQSARQERFPEFDDDESESSESEYSEEEEEEDRRRRKNRDARALMPPPQLIQKSTQRRPSLKHAKTYSVDRRMSQSQTLPERTKERDPRLSRVSTAVPSRANSVSRPTLIQQPKAQSAYETSRNAQVVVENPRSRRRQSYQEYERQYAEEQKRQYIEEQKRRNRSSKVYRDERDYFEDAVPSSTSRRRPTGESRRRNEYNVEPKSRQTPMDAAEAYQQQIRGSNAPYNEQVHKAAKRASRVPSGPSDSGSSRSKGSDSKSRMSQSNKTTVTNGGNGEIRLRVDASAPLSLQFNGDMDGRTLQINPTEGGMADIVIGNSQRDGESTYRSERGSVLGSSRKSLVANQSRREAEESSVRSGRSSQRREGGRRVLGRRRDTEDR